MKLFIYMLFVIIRKQIHGVIMNRHLPCKQIGKSRRSNIITSNRLNCVLPSRAHTIKETDPVTNLKVVFKSVFKTKIYRVAIIYTKLQVFFKVSVT